MRKGASAEALAIALEAEVAKHGWELESHYAWLKNVRFSKVVIEDESFPTVISVYVNFDRCMGPSVQVECTHAFGTFHGEWSTTFTVNGQDYEIESCRKPADRIAYLVALLPGITESAVYAAWLADLTQRERSLEGRLKGLRREHAEVQALKEKVSVLAPHEDDAP